MAPAGTRAPDLPPGRVAVAMSGGVDSSVAAALLVEAGCDVIGVTMRLGLSGFAGGDDSGEDETLLARRACDRLGIEHVVIDLAAEFETAVVTPFCDAYAAGLTPNPCVLCNEHIKLGLFAAHVRALGASTLATGHYARIAQDGGPAVPVWLKRGADRAKDQSYFLYRVSLDVLRMLVFPLGDLTKTTVRQLAIERGLPSAERAESQEVCFARDRVELIGMRHPSALLPGPIVDTHGTVLGAHHGIARYTVGQRKGIGVSGPNGPYRVVRIDAGRNALVVEGIRDSSECAGVTLAEGVWRLDGPDRVVAQARYRGTLEPARARKTTNGLEVTFDRPVPPLAPGQSLVLYQGERVVGGGFVPAAG